MQKFALAEFLIFLSIALLGYYGILHLENQVFSGIYFSFETLYDYTGWISFCFLFVGLWLSNPYAKFFGILAFVVALWHFLIFIHLDFGLEFSLILEKIFSEKHLIVGSLSFLAMLFTFFVSLFKLFIVFKMNFIVYCSVFFGVLHIVMLQKVLSPMYYILFGVTLCALAFKLWKIYRKTHIKL